MAWVGHLVCWIQHGMAWHQIGWMFTHITRSRVCADCGGFMDRWIWMEDTAQAIVAIAMVESLETHTTTPLTYR